MTFGIVGVNYRTAGTALRDRVSFDDGSARNFRNAAAGLGVRQVVTLSTCNRCEVFFWGGVGSMQKVRGLFLRTFGLAENECLIETRMGIEALVYLCRIAAGFESMVFGEYQILGQAKAAYADALASGHVGKQLDRIMRDAITCAKRVRTELDLGAVPPSVCRAGMDLVDARCGISGKRVFVIGSGRTGSLAVRIAIERGAASVAVCNRSPERTRKLREQYGVAVVDYSDRHARIAASDIVVSATASPHVVVQAAALRLDHPVTFLDLAVPRDVEPTVSENPLATLLGIDTIGELAAGDTAERERLAALGMEIVDRSVVGTLRWLEEKA